MDPRGGGQEIPRSHLVGFFGAENQRESHGTSSGSHEFSVTPSRLCDEVAQLTEMVRRKQEALTKFLKENEELKTSINDVKSEIKTLRKELAEKSDDNTSSSSGAAKRSCKLDTKLTLKWKISHYLKYEYRWLNYTLFTFNCQSQHRPLQPVLQNYVQPHQGSFSEFPVGSSQGMYSNSSLNYTTPPPQNGYAAEVSYCMLHISAFSVLLQGYMRWSPSSEEYQQISRAVPYYEGGIGLPRSTGSLPTSGSLGNQSTTPTRPASVRSRNQVVNDIFSDSDS
ncbi:uncharacterized protein [Dysidea avara]|uniref:uncharacterized protein n=1 Tax=Dysidea avara TaxID=196820 RepID=UPI0033231E31